MTKRKSDPVVFWVVYARPGKPRIEHCPVRRSVQGEYYLDPPPVANAKEVEDE